MGSGRLPGKVLLELPPGSSLTVLDSIISRARRSSSLDAVIIATSLNKADDAIAAFSKLRKTPCFRGDEANVLSRYCAAAAAYNFNTVVRLTGDNPCVDPALVDSTVRAHNKLSADYTYTSGYPLGIDVEVFDLKALKFAGLNASKQYEKEHVSPYLLSNPARFKIVKLKAPAALRTPEIRLTMDTREDYIALCAIFDLKPKSGKFFSSRDFIHLYQKHKWIKLLNGSIPQKNLVMDRNGELLEARRILKTYGLDYAASLMQAAAKRYKD